MTMLWSPILLSSMWLTSCTDLNLFKSGGLAGQGTTPVKIIDPVDPKDHGKCSLEFNLSRGSSLAPEKKKGDKTCLEYSPQAYQGADATGATILIISAVWCGPCKSIKAEFSQLQDIADKHKATVKIFLDSAQTTQSAIDSYGPAEFFVSLDIAALESKFGRIASFPTIIVIDKNGQQVMKSVGYSSVSGLFSEIDSKLEQL